MRKEQEELEEMKDVLDEENQLLNNRIQVLITELEQAHGTAE